MRSKVACFLALLACLPAACKKEEPPPTDPQADTGNKEVELKLDKSSSPTPPIAPPKINERGLPDLDFIYHTTRRFLVEQKRQAKDLDELIAMGYMPPLPPLPPGKKYNLNQRSAMIEIVDAPAK